MRASAADDTDAAELECVLAYVSRTGARLRHRTEALRTIAVARRFPSRLGDIGSPATGGFEIARTPRSTELS
jgi:hypothetical protein